MLVATVASEGEQNVLRRSNRGKTGGSYVHSECLATLSELKLITVRSVLLILPDEINNALLERVGRAGETTGGEQC